MTDLGILIIRVAVGAIFVYHGYSKLATRLQFANWFRSLKLPAPGFLAGFVIGTELFGGLAVVLGGAQWLPPLLLVAVMLGAIKIAHWTRVPDVSKGGWEFAALLLLLNIALILTGNGQYSLDHVVR